MEEIAPAALDAWITQGMRLRLVDVRSPSEFASGHLPGAVNRPLETLGSASWESGERIVLLCQAGTRARMAQQALRSAGVEACVLCGGTAAWRAEGRAIARDTATSWSLERQVRLGAGMLVLLGTLASALLDAKWLLLTGVVGAGLTFAGLTDICMMGNLLAHMPWNRRNT
ncbi:rhodanese-like domain-containing protein [Terriglobus albidus]|nr:rhodanese-like domain-containing protein [Terriglobus albidus]